VYQRIINLQPPHNVYVEPFLGSGAVMRRKRAAVRSFGVDLDQGVIRGALRAVACGSWALAPLAAGGDAGSVVLSCSDGIAWLSSRLFGERDLVYCDPPYLLSTRRRARRIYRYELGECDHEWLLGVLVRLPCLVQLSGYWSTLYADRLRAWWSTSYDVMTRGGRTAREWLWMNYQPPEELHDYRYLGSTFRERERIKRRRDRWVRRLVRMSPLERASMRWAMLEAWSPRSIVR
jgi:hypothetical protein